MSLFTMAFVWHLVADWLLQNHWMAVNKANLRHPAGWVHAAIHAVGMVMIFSAPVGLLIGVSHLLIDTRHPLRWWFRVYGQTTDGPFATHVMIWCDQVLHVVVIAIAVAVTVSLGISPVG